MVSVYAPIVTYGEQYKYIISYEIRLFLNIKFGSGLE